MAPLLPYVPLGIGLLVIVAPPLASVSVHVRGALTRTALRLFGSYVAQPSTRRRRRVRLVQGAHMQTMYRIYASRTLLYATLLALGGGLVGLYVIVLGLQVLALPAETIQSTLPEQLDFLAESLTLPALSSLEFLLLFLVSSATFGTVLGGGTYIYRWGRPRRLADIRERRIDESLPRTVAFLFALSRGGMSQEELIRILSQNGKYFGEAANEFSISLRDIEISGIDFLSAIRNLAHTTPSKEFANFAEDLTTVLRTGRPMSGYFREKYEQYQEDKETHQTQVLEQLAALAEGYVALLVAGPLFLITILVIIGLLIGGTVGIIRGFVYVVLPLTSIGFMYYVGNLAASLGIDVEIDDHSLEMGTMLDQTNRDESSPGNGRTSSRATAADGGHSERSTDGGVVTGTHRENRRRLGLYNRFKSLHRSIVDPIRAITDSPDTVLYLVAPVAALYVIVRTYVAFAGGTLSLRVFDDYLVQATLFLLSTFAVAEYLHSSKQEQIEDALPDFMDRLADQTGAGMTLTRSIRELDATSVPGLEQAIRELQTDISWGGRTSYALVRLAERTKSVFMTRAVILMTNAMHASGDVAPVLRIAADEAQTDRRLRRRREQELFIYQIIIYVSMLVFIGIIVALDVVFIPSLPSAESLTGSVPSAGGAPGVGGLLGGIGGSQVNRDAYSLVLLHSAMIQGLLAGFVAGKMGEGSVRAGAKHAALLLGVAYGITFLL